MVVFLWRSNSSDYWTMTGMSRDTMQDRRSAVVLVGFPDPVRVPKSKGGINQADRKKVSLWTPTYTDTGTKIEPGSMPAGVAR